MRISPNLQLIRFCGQRLRSQQDYVWSNKNVGRHLITYLWHAWTYFNRTYHSYSLPSPLDTDDIFKVMGLKVKVTGLKNALFQLGEFAVVDHLQCVREKRDQHVFFVISSIKLWRFWWDLVFTSFLNKFAAKIGQHFPPHLNNVSTLPCETWNYVHHAGATTALSEKETPEFIPSQLWPPNSPDLNPVDYSMWE